MISKALVRLAESSNAGRQAVTLGHLESPKFSINLLQNELLNLESIVVVALFLHRRRARCISSLACNTCDELSRIWPDLGRKIFDEEEIEELTFR